MTTDYKLDKEIMPTEPECRQARDQRDAERRRHQAHLGIDARLKHDNKLPKTKLFGIGALRRNRQLKSIERAERFDSRSMAEFVPIEHVPASREEMPSSEHVTLTSHSNATSLWPLAELARVHGVGSLFNRFMQGSKISIGDLPVLTKDELDELTIHLGTGFRVFSA